jgi:hypothetical protein
LWQWEGLAALTPMHRPQIAPLALKRSTTVSHPQPRTPAPAP